MVNKVGNFNILVNVVNIMTLPLRDIKKNKMQKENQREISKVIPRFLRKVLCIIETVNPPKNTQLRKDIIDIGNTLLDLKSQRKKNISNLSEPNKGKKKKGIKKCFIQYK